MGKRPYVKRNKNYWDSIGKKNGGQQVWSINDQNEWLPVGINDSTASVSSSDRTATRFNRITKQPAKHRFSNIADGLLPYQYSRDNITVRDAIELTQKAYFNFAAFRSTIDLMSEFSNSDIYLENGSERSRKFVDAWFRKIKLDCLKEQFFREYFRSGNCFLYEMRGELDSALNKSFLKSEAKFSIPVRYIVLNPADISASSAVSFNQPYYLKLLSQFELERLKDPKTEEDKEIFDSLDDEAKRQIKAGGTTGEIFLKLDPEKTNAIFFKKQDYEPFAIPLGFSILDDLNRKEELKKVDQAISRKTEQCLLLVTMGAKPDDGGINHNHLNALQEIFKNQSVQRVLVSDYTTKAEFVIPDLNKVVGEEKYKVLNRDILDGLQNMLLGESKFADMSMKLKIFMRRLNNAREAFINDFLQPEVKRICKNAGLRNYPDVKFKKADVLDDADVQKLVIRMMELGILTPEQGMNSIHTGTFPKSKDMVDEQKKFLEERKEGYYMPIANSINLRNEDFERQMQRKEVNQKVKTTDPSQQSQNPSATSKTTSGRPIAASKYSTKDLMDVNQSITDFYATAEREFGLEYGGIDFSDKQKEIIAKTCETIISSCDKEEWENALKEILKDNTKLLNYNIKDEVLSIASEHQLNDLSAAILYHSSLLGEK